MDIERELKILIDKHKGKQVGLGEIRLDCFAEDCLKEIRRLKSAIARQSATSEEVQEAIEYVNDWRKESMTFDRAVGILPPTSEETKAYETILTALQAYDPEPPKGE